MCFYSIGHASLTNGTAVHQDSNRIVKSTRHDKIPLFDNIFNCPTNFIEVYAVQIVVPYIYMQTNAQYAQFLNIKFVITPQDENSFITEVPKG